MSWKFVKAKFKVGNVVRFPYGKRIGKIKAVGLQVSDYDGAVLACCTRSPRMT